MSSISLQLLPENLEKDEIEGPTDWSNWVIKGRLLAGSYPGRRDEKEHEKVITHIVEQAGVTTFVCLQTEDELKRFRPYKEFALSLKDNLKFVDFPIEVGEFDEVYNLIEDLKSRLYQGEVLYVHCFGGHGRTGTIIACLLARLFDLSADRALELTAKYHSCRRICTSTSPQESCQFDQVRDMVARYQKEKGTAVTSKQKVVV